MNQTVFGQRDRFGKEEFLRGLAVLVEHPMDMRCEDETDADD